MTQSDSWEQMAVILFSSLRFFSFIAFIIISNKPIRSNSSSGLLGFLRIIRDSISIKTRRIVFERPQLTASVANKFTRSFKMTARYFFGLNWFARRNFRREEKTVNHTCILTTGSRLTFKRRPAGQVATTLESWDCA